MTFLLLPILTSLTGCAPATVQTARTNGQGNFQFGIEPGIVGASGGGVTAVAPAFNLAGRYGVSDNLDIGARIGTGAYELQLKYMFTDAAEVDSMAISLAPSATFFAFGGGGAGFAYLDTRLPLLFGIPVGESEFTVGPTLRPTLVLGGGGGATAGGLILQAGGQVGFAAKVADNFRIVPQLDFGIPVLGAAAGGGQGGAGVGFGGTLFGFQLGFLVGGG